MGNKCELIGVSSGVKFTIEHVLGNTWVAVPTGETMDGTMQKMEDGNFIYIPPEFCKVNVVDDE